MIQYELRYLTLPCACISDHKDGVSHSQQLLKLNNLHTDRLSLRPLRDNDQKTTYSLEFSPGILASSAPTHTRENRLEVHSAAYCRLLT